MNRTTFIRYTAEDTANSAPILIAFLALVLVAVVIFLRWWWKSGAETRAKKKCIDRKILELTDNGYSGVKYRGLRNDVCLHLGLSSQEDRDLVDSRIKTFISRTWLFLDRDRILLAPNGKHELEEIRQRELPLVSTGIT